MEHESRIPEAPLPGQGVQELCLAFEYFPGHQVSIMLTSWIESCICSCAVRVNLVIMMKEMCATIEAHTQ